MKDKMTAEKYMPPELLKEVRSTYQEECRKELLGFHISNFLWNVRLAPQYPGIIKFEKLFPNYPAVIVGVGPSLDKHIELVKKYRKNILLVAVDASLPILKKYDIVPDFVGVVDPTAKQADNFKDIDTTQFYTVIPPVAHPSVFRKLDPMHTLLYNVKDPQSPIMEQAPYHTGQKGALPAGVLTSGTCFAFSAIMHCNPIMFIGHDLSWPTPDNVYSKDIAQMKKDFQKGAKFRSNCLLFPDINGKLVLTHSTFLNFWAWMKDFCKAATVRVINCSEAGILLNEDMRAIPFEVALKRYASKELVGVKTKIEKIYMESKFPNGLVEKLLTPKFKSARKQAEKKVAQQQAGE